MSRLKSRPTLYLLTFLFLTFCCTVAEAELSPESESLIASVVLEFATADGPGCSVGVLRQGELVYEQGFGLADLEHNVPITTDTVFDTGSVSKQFVAASVAILALQGKVDLNADIRTYLPKLPEYAHPITVRQLIAHSGGIPDVYKLLELLGNDPDGNFYPSELTLEIIYRMKELEFVPGTQYEYSNAGYLLLAQIVEVVSGQTMRQFAQENIFGPLGMAHTHFHDNYREIVPNRGEGYGWKDDGSGWEIRNSNFYVVGDGGVFSNVKDLALWDRNFYHNQLYGGEEFLELIQTPFQYSESGAEFRDKPIGYAFALMLDEVNGNRMVYHPGGWAGSFAVFARFPDRQLSLILQCNARKPGLGAMVDKLMATLLEMEELDEEAGADDN